MGENYDVPIGPLEWDFVPEFGEGKITCKLRQLTVEEVDGCINTSFSGTIMRSKMVLLGLLGLTGITAEGVPVETADQLLLAPQGLAPLYMEIWRAIQAGSTVTEEESKN